MPHLLFFRILKLQRKLYSSADVKLAGSNVCLELARLRLPLVRLLVVELKVAWSDGELHNLCLARSKTYLLEALELLYRTVYRTLQVAYRELNHFLALTRT